jgi:hypothetical protein
MEKMERYRFIVGGAAMALLIAMAALLALPGAKKSRVPTFEELAGPEPDTKLQEISLLLAEWEATQHSAEVLEALQRQADALEAIERQGEQNNWTETFEWESLPRQPNYDYWQNPLADYMAELRLRQHQRRVRWDQTEMMNTMRSIESNLDQIGRELQQAEWGRQLEQRQLAAERDMSGPRPQPSCRDQ